ncbi:MAG: methyltransferase domain-containing protein [Rhodobacteraceae bacterium]|nr:methyltransferase domain-containing protein [Paracoccaceae bacterium]
MTDARKRADAAIRLTDRAALERQRKRAKRNSGAPGFLHEAALEEIHHRLADINRSFENPAIVTGFPSFWRNACPAALIVSDADPLPLAAQCHDLVIHAMALHWADDPVGQLVQCRLALRPDGLLLAVCPGGDTLIELRTSLMEAEIHLRGGASPRVVPMAGIGDYGTLLQRSGFALPVADRMVLPVTYKSPLALMQDLRTTGEGNALAARSRVPPPRSLFDAAAKHYRTGFPAADGRIEATFELMFLTGWAPAEGQPKPLRPGSAEARLADALGTNERKLER